MKLTLSRTMLGPTELRDLQGCIPQERVRSDSPNPARYGLTPNGLQELSESEVGRKIAGHAD
ncbi:MAG TPA: hypothetical protein VJ728_17510 [Candidatus Binataceae bacterium]|nr:hypothetical protein [Candidatus Binataceae bacterium]